MFDSHAEKMRRGRGRRERWQEEDEDEKGTYDDETDETAD
jgi:hypothetical protein